MDSQQPGGSAQQREPAEVGSGIAVVRLERMERVLARTPRFAGRVFTQEERALCERSKQPCVQYAMRFAAKLAALRAMECSLSDGISPADVEVLRSAAGRPQVRLHRKAADAARRHGVLELPVSLSHTRVEAVACAVAITEDSAEAVRPGDDPKTELARRFKELRGFLDALPSSGGGAGPADAFEQERFEFAEDDRTAGAGCES